MPDRYDFANLSLIEFEGLCVDLVEAETGLRFERFSEGADGCVDGRHGRADGDIILQAKHYKNSTWSDLQKAVKTEKKNIAKLKPSQYCVASLFPLGLPEAPRVLRMSGRYSTSDYFHIVRIRAATSTRICCALRSDAAALTTGQVPVSKNWSSVAGMNRVLDA